MILGDFMDNNTVCSFEKKKKRQVPIWVCAICILLAVLVTASSIFAVIHFSSIGKIAIKLKEIDDLVNANYMGEIDYGAIDDAVFSAYIDALDDKYAFYEGIEDAESVADSFEGNSSGIGVSVFYNNDEKSLQVFRIDTNGPADLAGIQVGDRIIGIDDLKVSEAGYKKSLAAIKKNIGQTAVITLIRGNEELKFTLEYKDFVRQTVYSHIINGIGYMCITAFNEATVEQFSADLENLIAQNIKGLIFDLRDNGGGTVDSVCKILDSLVGECTLMTVKYSDGTEKVVAKSDKEEINLPMAVLTNGSTASASELFAATIRDMNKGVLIGENTYGKGVMQRTYFLSDKSCVRFTVGLFYPAGGVNFNEVGLTPDYNVSLTEEEQENRYVLGDDDPYIKKALEVLSFEK